MNKLSVSLIVITVLSFQAFSQSAFTWEKSFGGSDFDGGYSIAEAINGGYLIAGFSWSVDGDVNDHHGSSGYPDGWVVRVDADGNTIWTKSLGGTREEYANMIKTTQDGNYIIAGQASSIDGDVWDHNGAQWYYDVWLVKLNDNGDTLWTRSYGGTSDDAGYAIDLTSDGGYIVGAISSSNDSDVWGAKGSDDFWILRLDSIGDTLWTRTYGGTSGDYLENIISTDDGGFLAVGWTYSNDIDVTGNHGGRDAWALKTDSIGNIQWQNTLGGTWWDYAFSADQTQDGNYIIGGTSESVNGDVWDNNGWFDYWIVKLNAVTGDTMWTRSYGGSRDDWGRSIQTTCDGGFIVSGYSYSNNGDVSGHYGSLDSSDYWLIKLDKNGGIEWEQNYGGTGIEYNYNVIQTDDGYYLTTGLSTSPDGDVSFLNGKNDMWTIKLKSNRVKPVICLVTVDSTSTKNVIVWEKPITANIDSFRIYRELGTNNYQHIVSIPYSSLSVYVDPAVNPNQTSYRYKMSVIDSCGNESDTSSLHKTIHLFITSDINGKPVIQWTDYEGFPVTAYNILRDSTGLYQWEIIGTVGFGITSFTDQNPVQNGRYIVEVVSPDTCTATQKAENYNSSKSNTSTSVTGINEFDVGSLEFMVYPNPGKGVFTLSTNYEPALGGQNIRIVVYDVLGREAFKFQVPNPKSQNPRGEFQIDLSGQPAGIYHLRVITVNAIFNRKIVIE